MLVSLPAHPHRQPIAMCTLMYTFASLTLMDNSVTPMVGVRDLRSDLAGYIRRAQAGERITISASGSPVAALGPLQSADSAPPIHDLAAAGLVISPRRSGSYRLRPMILVWAGTRIERVVRQLRG